MRIALPSSLRNLINGKSNAYDRLRTTPSRDLERRAIKAKNNLIPEGSSLIVLILVTTADDCSSRGPHSTGYSHQLCS